MRIIVSSVSVSGTPGVAVPAARGTLRRRLRYEATIVGLAAFAAPPIVLVSFTGLGILIGDAGRMLTAAVEAGVPLAVGIYAALLPSADPSLELQLALPRGFRPAALRRLAVLGAWAAVLSLAAVTLGRASGLLARWPGNTGPLQDALMPLAPLAAFAVFGCLLGLALRSRGAASAAVTSIWLVLLVWKDTFIAQPALAPWFPFQFTFAPGAANALATRLSLLGVTGVALVIVVAWLGLDEWLLGSEDR